MEDNFNSLEYQNGLEDKDKKEQKEKENRKIKTRNLSAFDFLEELQIEYCVSEIRKKIYIKPNDINYYKRLMKYKKQKIEDICERNSLPNMFTDDSIKKQIYAKVYNEEGLPNFHYKEDASKVNVRTGKLIVEEQKVNDVKYYYYPETEIKINEDGDVKIGKLKEVDIKENIGKVKLRYEEGIKTVPLHRVTRIL